MQFEHAPLTQALSFSPSLRRAALREGRWYRGKMAPEAPRKFHLFLCLAAGLWSSASLAQNASEPSAPELPSHYYIETEEPAGEASPRPSSAEAPPKPQRREPAVLPPVEPAYEPPLPSAWAGARVYEPPPPPIPRHRAPNYALWVGARVGLFSPFGNAWSRCKAVDRGGYCLMAEGVPWRDYASTGPMGQLDIGVRLGRQQVLFFSWERAQLGSGDFELEGRSQQAGESDFLGVGLRYSSNPSNTGFLVEVMLGGRRARAKWDDGSEMRFEDAPFESRIGIGADIRLTNSFSISPMLTLGGGQFDDITFYSAEDGTTSNMQELVASHAWLTLHLGAHFDLFGTQSRL